MSDEKDLAAIKAELAAKQDLELKKCQAELSELLKKYNVELVPSMTIQDGRIHTQMMLRPIQQGA